MLAIKNLDHNELPLVSVIIPTYNRGQFIKEAINSVLDQTYKNFEIIVVDDGSTDETQGIIKEIDDPRLIYYYQENQGRSKARNYALKIAKGKYITFLDSDDIYLPEKLKLQVDYLNLHSNFHMVYTSAYCIEENGTLSPHKYIAETQGKIYKEIAFFIPITITLPTVMVHKEVFEKVGTFDESLHRFEDTDMWRRISKFYEIGVIPEFTCKLRTHTDNTLVNQDPEVIEASIKDYSAKILQEDTEFPIRLRKEGISRIYRYYGFYLSQIPKFHEKGQKLMKIADTIYKPPLHEKLIIILKKVFYKILRMIYKAYNCLENKNIKFK